MAQWLSRRTWPCSDQSTQASWDRLLPPDPQVGEGRGCFFKTFLIEIERRLQICSSENLPQARAALQAEFQEQLLKIKEHSRQKDEEIEGGWYTEERLEKDLGWSKSLGPDFLCSCAGCTSTKDCDSCHLAKSLVIEFHNSMRLIIGKVKAYCTRFKSVLTRQGTCFSTPT